MPATAKYLPAEKRRAATVQAVVALAARHNPSELTTTVIAKRMGLTQGALFKHFPTKEAITQAVMDWVAERLMARVGAAIDSAPSPMAALEAVFLAHAEFVAAHPGVPRIVFSEMQHSRLTAPKRVVRAMLARYAKRVEGIISEAKERGEVEAMLDTGAASILFVGMIQGLVMQSLLSGDVARIRGDAPRVFAIYRRGLGSAP